MSLSPDPVHTDAESGLSVDYDWPRRSEGTRPAQHTELTVDGCVDSK